MKLRFQTLAVLASLTLLILGVITADAVVGARPADEPTGFRATTPTQRPNIVLVLTDDLDLQLDTLNYTPAIRSLMTDQGLTFSQFFANVSLCCPSRSSLLRGQYVHNHQVYTNGPPTGGFQKAYASGIESATIATALQSAGYRTALMGKYLNGYPDTAAANYIPPGWSEWYSPISGNAYSEFNYTLNENGTSVAYGTTPQDYLVDVLSRKATNFITRTAALDTTPFFLYIAPYVPHQPATPAPRYSALFPNVQAPRLPSWNEADISDKPSNIRKLPALSPTSIQQIDTLYRRRLQSMQAVDDMLTGVVQALQATGQLENTYIILTSDNGYHMGEHRLMPGKYLPYEEDIHIPLIIRGPGIPAGQTNAALTSMVDLAPTFAELAGVTLPVAADGRSLVRLFEQQPSTVPWRQAVLVEQYPIATQEPASTAAAPKRLNGYEPYDTFDAQIDPTAFYFGLRTGSYKYVEYSNDPSTGERELYDLQNDPYELQNLVSRANPVFLSQLSAWLAALRTCSGASCRTADAMTPPQFALTDANANYMPFISKSSE